MKIEINISDWHALAPGISTKADWGSWAKSGVIDNTSEIEFGLIPSRMRRRMSVTSKLAVQTALQLSSRNTIDSAIFVSRHGELQRTHSLINEILRGDGASPIAFSQSVHNTGSGLFSIAAEFEHAVTSLAACEDSFQQGVVEAAIRLKSSPRNRILLVCFDDIVPDVYSPFVCEDCFPYSLGLILEFGNKCSVETISNSTSNTGTLPQALTFLKHFCRGESCFEVTGVRSDWKWSLLN